MTEMALYLALAAVVSFFVAKPMLKKTPAPPNTFQDNVTVTTKPTTKRTSPTTDNETTTNGYPTIEPVESDGAGIPLATVTATIYLDEDGEHYTMTQWHNHINPLEEPKFIERVFLADGIKADNVYDSKDLDD